MYATVAGISFPYNSRTRLFDANFVPAEVITSNRTRWVGGGGGGVVAILYIIHLDINFAEWRNSVTTDSYTYIFISPRIIKVRSFVVEN